MPEKGSKNHYSWKNCSPPKKNKTQNNILFLLNDKQEPAIGQ